MSEIEPPHNNHQLQKELDRTRRELAMLYEVSSAMRRTLDLRHILYIILTSVTSHSGLGFNRAILYLVNSLDRCLEPQMALGPESLEDAQKIWSHISTSHQSFDDLIEDEKLNQNLGRGSLFESVRALKIPLSTAKDNLLITSYLEGSPKHITQDEIGNYKQDPLLKLFDTKELIIMPLKVKDQVNGLIIADNLYTQKPISGDDLKIFSMLANQAGLAIENSRLFEMTKHKSHTDALTNLWNHGYFQDKLTEEMAGAGKAGQAVGLLMIDIDNFKSLNDRHGHQTGDIVLKEIAGILRESSRPGDYVCRYGGEEFAVILAHSDEEQGYAIAERIRENIARHSFPALVNDQPLQVTVSIGLAAFPGEAIRSKHDLIAEADKAMYSAKFSGKNKTCVA